MKTICNSDCCEKCPLKSTACAGCIETDGHPCGGSCFVADCIKNADCEAFEKMKSEIIDEINSLEIEELKIDNLNTLIGSFVNLEYDLPNGQKVKLLEDNKVYLGNQIERKNGDRCYGVVADEKNILVCEYGCYGADPEIIIYKKR